MAQYPSRNYDQEEYSRDWHDDPRRQRAGSPYQSDWGRDPGQMRRRRYASEREDWPGSRQTSDREDYGDERRGGSDSDRERWRDEGERSWRAQDQYARQEGRDWRYGEESGRGRGEGRYLRDEESRPYSRGYSGRGSSEHEGPYTEGRHSPYSEQRGFERFGTEDRGGSYRSERPSERRFGSPYSGYEGTTSPHYDYPGTRGTMGSEREGMRGPFSGKGPKGYKRSDDRLKEDVCERLERQGDIDASEIEVICKDGMVTLKGSIEDRMSKRRAEEAVERVYGVKDVMNELRVEDGQSEKTSTSATGEKQRENERQRTGSQNR